MEKHSFDIVIVGSGAGGGTIAWALSHSGMKVLLLETGPRYDPNSDYKLRENDWEKPFPHKIKTKGRCSFGQSQKLSKKWDDLRSWNHLTGRINKGNNRAYFGYHRVLGVGGSSLHFTGEAHRMNPLAMSMKSRFNVAADWPVSYDELEPYYNQAEYIVGVAGPDIETVRYRSQPYPQKAHNFSYGTQHLNNGFMALKMKLVPNALAILSKPKDGRPACNFCGGCLRGCSRTDKGSIDVTYLRLAEKTGNCEIRPETTVLKIETDGNDMVSGLHCVTIGERYFLTAPSIIISAGAIETPRLLLNSKSENSPDGLCNESGQVGKNFMETLIWTSSGLHDNNLGSHRGIPVDGICWDYNAPDAIPNVIGGCRFSSSLAESDLVGPIAYANRIVGGWGDKHKQQMEHQFGRALSITGISESLPHDNSNVKLDKNQNDKYGFRIAQITSFLDEMGTRRIAFMADKCRSILHASGVREIIEEFSSYDVFSSTHVFGTCRMGNDKKSSVVDAQCKSHRWKNLYIVDASVFPSSGGGESPGLTIQALALKTAEHINFNRKN